MNAASSRISILAALACLFVGGVSPAFAQSELISDPAKVQRILSLLDDGYWIPDGADANRQVYVIYSTTCGYCKKLHANTRNVPKRPQLRWITAGEAGYGAEDAVSRRSAAAIGDAFNNRAKPPADPVAAGRALDINKAIAFALPDFKRSVYPTLVYLTPQGLRIHYGMPSDLKLLDTVKARPEQATHQPASLKWVNESIALTRVPKLASYHSRQGGTPVTLAPQPGAPAVLQLEKDYGYPVDSVANGEWARVKLKDVGGKPVFGYIHAPKEIRLASLQYQVKPARGGYQSGKRTLEARGQPSLEADVLEVIEPGMQMTKTGEVLIDGARWTEVLLYTDGTKGYIRE
jgi:hypothetical protein